MWIALTLVVYLLSVYFLHRIKIPFLNSLLISMIAIIAILLVLDVPFETYYAQTNWINYFMQAAVVAFAYPLYEQLPQIRSNMKFILLSCLASCSLAVLFTGFVAWLFDAPAPLLASLLVKSITTPIALEISGSLNGQTSIVIVLGLFAGLTGAILFYPIFKLLGVNESVQRGIIVGSLSHAIGTSATVKHSSEDTAFSSVALIIAAIFSSFLAPMAYQFFTWI
ncbi:LrgB family protein [Aliiglaciecola sp. 2_MG-2023]|uniref:LrgB family protein n=1 Tax=Alteromonadaceae TaxID=72275 RepID=UPI0026E1E670|nr:MULTISPECIES: LrgB family protein [unclassified Aliiglaciecola]MDO6710904.1 LrgB family protein [Aliiglaciecola sp. 2_MG-2023]MDO6752385.1 LrgB family protein [Aliiglaciecola sp. 1_MG-2023]